MKRKQICGQCGNRVNTLIHNLCKRCHRKKNKIDNSIISKSNKFSDEKIIFEIFGKEETLKGRKLTCDKVKDFQKKHRDKVKEWDRKKKKKRYDNMNAQERVLFLAKARRRSRLKDPDRNRVISRRNSGKQRALKIMSLKWDDKEFWNPNKKPAKSRVKFKYFEFH